MPLDSIVENVGEENFIPGSLLYWPFDGHLYQFTSDLSAGTLYWRKDLFEEAGLAEPDSYERLLEASERLHGQDGVSGNAFEASNNGGVQRFVTFLWQNCGDFYTKEGDLAFDREGSRQAVEDYAALNQYTPSGSHSWGNLDPINAYAAGRVGMALFPGRLGYQVATNAPDIAKVTGNREARVARGGEGPRVVYGAVTSYAIGSTVRHPEEAKKFLEYLFTGDQLLQYAMGVPGHIAPAIKSVQAQMLEQDDPYIKEHRDWVETILEATTYFNAEAQNMGSITEECVFEKSLVPMPWSSRVMGQSPVTSTMFQRIQLQDTPGRGGLCRGGRDLPHRDGGVAGREPVVRRVHEQELTAREDVGRAGDRAASRQDAVRSAGCREERPMAATRVGERKRVAPKPAVEAAAHGWSCGPRSGC